MEEATPAWQKLSTARGRRPLRHPDRAVQPYTGAEASPRCCIRSRRQSRQQCEERTLLKNLNV